MKILEVDMVIIWAMYDQESMNAWAPGMIHHVQICQSQNSNLIVSDCPKQCEIPHSKIPVQAMIHEH